MSPLSLITDCRIHCAAKQLQQERWKYQQAHHLLSCRRCGVKPGSPVPWENAPIYRLVNSDLSMFYGDAHSVQEPWGLLYCTKVEDEKDAFSGSLLDLQVR